MALLSPMGIFGFDIAVAYRGLTCGWQCRGGDNVTLGWQRRGGVYPHPNPAKQINFNKEDYKLPSIPSKMVRLEKKPLHKMCSGFFVYIIP